MGNGVFWGRSTGHWGDGLNTSLSLLGVEAQVSVNLSRYRLNIKCFHFFKKKNFSLKRNQDFSETGVGKELKGGTAGKQPDTYGLLQTKSTAYRMLWLPVRCAQSLEGCQSSNKPNPILARRW